MSNQRLVEKVRQTIAEQRSRTSSVQPISEPISSAIRALEGMPYSLVRELDGLLLDLEYAEANERDGFADNRSEILDQLVAVLKKVPLNV